MTTVQANNLKYGARHFETMKKSIFVLLWDQKLFTGFHVKSSKRRKKNLYFNMFNSTCSKQLVKERWREDIICITNEAGYIIE